MCFAFKLAHSAPMFCSFHQVTRTCQATLITVFPIQFSLCCFLWLMLEGRIGTLSLLPKIILNLNQRPQFERLCDTLLGFVLAKEAFMDLVAVGTLLGKGSTWEIYLPWEVGADFLGVLLYRQWGHVIIWGEIAFQSQTLRSRIRNGLAWFSTRRTAGVLAGKHHEASLEIVEMNRAAKLGKICDNCWLVHKRHLQGLSVIIGGNFEMGRKILCCASWRKQN